MKKHDLSFGFLFLLFLFQSIRVDAQSPIPKPDHIVIAILESHGYAQLIGSSAAPYINYLAKDNSSALFSESYALFHPSQPNYLILFSGNTQGVTSNDIPFDNPFTTPNLARQLIDAGKTFITYSEDLPNVGYNEATSGYYARKHNPVTNWMGTGINQVSVTTNQPFTAFPTNNFSSLPTISFVVPNLENDMHNSSDPDRIGKGDKWLSNNLDGYIQWAKSHNSLFILTFDEEGQTVENHILTIITGEHVKSGLYSDTINHYSVLHTLEKMFGLPYIGNELTIEPITYCWKDTSAESPSTHNQSYCSIYPNPTNGEITVEMFYFTGATVELYNLDGQIIMSSMLESVKTKIQTNGLSKGVYLLKIRNDIGVTLRKICKN